MTKPIAKNQPQLTTITFAGIALPSGVLLDMDPQGNASSGVGVRAGTREHTVYDAIIGRSCVPRLHDLDLR